MTSVIKAQKMKQLLKRVLAFKVRKKRRFRVKAGAYVLLSNAPGRYQIEDIGAGGLSFHYIDNGLKTRNASQQLKIIADNQPVAVHLAGRIVSESDIGELIFERQKIKRRSIQFDRMNSQTKHDLDVFIKQNT